ncbi:hypothetical protein AZ46_0207190 [Metabacillus indicus LMG 22858]|nr:hypothetical protein AZ46_0207190 [Metabacillus indicus LMG 22858]
MIIGKAELKGSAFLIVQLLPALPSEQNPPKSQNRTFRVISFLPVRAKRSAPLFLLSSSSAQLLCQNGTVGKGKKAPLPPFPYLTPGAKRALPHFSLSSSAS